VEEENRRFEGMGLGLEFIFLFRILSSLPFTRTIWKKNKEQHKLSTGWTRTSVKDCFANWAFQNHSLSSLPTFICWFIWLERNLAIFESRNPSLEKVIFLSLGAVRSHRPQERLHSIRRSVHILPLNRIIGWFDGAAQKNGEQSGAGGVIKLNEHSVYKWTLNCGGGSNTRAELLGVWASLTLAHRLSITDFHVIGDSKIVIDWLNDKGSLQTISIDCWKNRIKELFKFFSAITFAHVYREENLEADFLSKKALTAHQEP
jgi:ribonuclease HI